MARFLLLLAAVLAVLAGPASASASAPLAGPRRDLQSWMVAGIEFPDITEFLPPLDQVQLPNIDGILKSAGMPTYEELGLPPIAQLLMPAGGVRGLSIPSLADALTQANSVFRQVLYEELPKPLKPLAKFDASKAKINVTALAARFNTTVPRVVANLNPIGLPRLPVGLPPLGSLLKTASPLLSAAGVNTTGLQLPKLAAMAQSVWAARNKGALLPPPSLPKNLPSVDEVLTLLTRAQKVISLLPAAENMPSLDQVLAVVNALNKVSGLLGGGGAAPSASG